MMLLNFQAAGTAAVCAALLFGIYISGLVAYRLLWHPYAKYPGPWLARISNFYAAYHGWTGDIHVDMWRCHQKYGPLVRYAPDRLLFNETDALREIYSHKSNVLKSKTYDALVHRAPNVLTHRDRRQHARRRRVISQALSDASVSSFEPAILEQVWKFVRHFALEAQRANGWSRTVNVAKWCDYLTFDIMAAMVFSASYDLLGKMDDRPVIDAILDSNVRMSVLFQYPALARWRVNKRLFPAAIRGRDIFIKFVSRLVGDRVKLVKAQTCTNDVFSFLTKARDRETGEGLSLNELAAECTTLVVAGSDTTSTAMAAVMYYLAKNPTCLHRANEEVRSAFADASEIRLGSGLTSCKFLMACINEAMRMTPSAGSALWREVQDGGLTVSGQFIPPGYDVGVGIWSIHHNERIFPNAFKFDPERWLTSDTEGDGSANSERTTMLDAYSPFSRGPRSCVGKGIATVELQLTFAALLWSLDFRFEPGCEPEPDKDFHVEDHITGAKFGPELQFRERSV